MKSHKIQPEKLYPVSIPEEPEPIYPHMEIPASVFEGSKCQIGDTYRVEVLVEIVRMDEQSYGCELIESEIESDEEEAKENE